MEEETGLKELMFGRYEYCGLQMIDPYSFSLAQKNEMGQIVT